MSAVVTRESLFQSLLTDRKITGRETSDQLVEICDAAGMFDDDPGMRRASQTYKARVIRSLARQDGWEDADGNPVELVNIVQFDPESGKRTQVYVDLKQTTFDEMAYLVRDRAAKVDYFKEERDRFLKLGCKRFGRKFQRLFQFEA